MTRSHRWLAGLAVPGLALAAIALAAGACARRDAPPAPDRLAPLHVFEEARRAATDFARVPPADRAFGADPYALRALPGGGRARFAGLLRGRDALVLLDASLHEIARAPAPASPSGLAVAPDGEIFVAGELSPAIARFRVEEDRLREVGVLEIPGARALRDVAMGPERVLYAVEEHDGRLLALPLDGGPRRELVAGPGAFRVARAGNRVIVDCLLDHSLIAYRVDAHGLPIEEGAARIRHDGPIWGFDAIAEGGDLLIATGGVEDRPLDRTGGSFGYVDSFVSLYRLRAGDARAERLAEVNVSSLGVVTPKALLLRLQGGKLSAMVAGYGSDRLLTLSWSADRSAQPSAETAPFVPGASAVAPAEGGALAFADPLLDGWILARPGDREAPPLVPVADEGAPARSPASRLGEALFFTTLMAPWNRTEGPLSRFTCETCHFEGYADGRTHHTGRGDVHATTKPLYGLFNNRPHFSRALDPDLATVADNEFRVAGALSGHDPWFAAPVAELPWVKRLGVPEAELGPEAMRKALMTFLMEFAHRASPAAPGRAAWSPVERRGAEVFARRCEGCHAARLAADDPASRIPFERWEALIFSREDPIVWGRSGYEKTGVVPYVHEQGARPPSLRRLYKKRPYFTNGAAKDLRGVLDRARWDAGGAFFHDGAPEGATALGADEQEALAAFLDLL